MYSRALILGQLCCCLAFAGQLSAQSFEQSVAENTLDDRFDASPALVGNQLFLRGRKNLYCVADDPFGR